MFQTQIGGKFAALNLIDCKRDTIANDINEGLLVTVEEILGGNRENPYLDNERNFDEARSSSNIAQRGQEEDEINQRELATGERCDAIEKGMKQETAKRPTTY